MKKIAQRLEFVDQKLLRQSSEFVLAAIDNAFCKV